MTAPSRLSPAPALPAASVADDRPWRTEGLFSPHYLTHRLPGPQSGAWPASEESDAAFDSACARFDQSHAALQAGSEEDCEDQWISPLLQQLGFGWKNRKAIPQAAALALPDYLLYASPALAEAAFQTKAYYPDCLGLLEAKKWSVNLSREGAKGKGDKGKARSPQTQLRDYLTELDTAPWGILTNGARWRLYCKRDRAGRFFEFDLERVLLAARQAETRAQAREDFRLFYALFRRAAFERGPDGLCILDSVREEAQQFKAEVERRLRVQVFDCVETLARGFLHNPDNHLGASDLPDIYQNCLILLYRILFVLNAEARGLLPTRPHDTPSRKYYQSYGLEWVRRILAAPTDTPFDDDQTFALAERLRALFTLINGKPALPGKPDKNTELNIPRYNGGLFDPAAHGFLETMRVADGFLADALRRLAYRTDGAELVAFDYANLGERHLGSIYEGLLEHRLRLSPAGEVRLANDKGERKTSGAYYTPADWVSYIVRQTLRPVLDAIDTQISDGPLAPNSGGTGEEKPVLSGAILTPPELGAGGPSDSFAEAVLLINVCDPAMGSGHFLVEAVALLADAVAEHPTTAPRPALGTDGLPARDGQGEPVCTEEAKLAYWKRRLVEACIYGVDLNPLAVELAKLSLWLETVDRVPLNFLDHHLRCGNSLLGTTLAALPSYPVLKKSTKKKNDAQLSLGFNAELTDALTQAIAEIGQIEGVSTDTHGAAKQKERLWRNISQTLMPRFREAADLWLAPWFGGQVTYTRYQDVFTSADKTHALYTQDQDLLHSVRPFHWELEFPDVFFDEAGQRKANAGFDAVVGNPPWERIKLQENEFFAGRSAAIALAPKAADRKKLIAALPHADPDLWAAFLSARDRAEQTQGFVHRSGFYPLMGRGDTNLYAVFAEKALQLVSPTGRVGLLVPSGIATDDTTKAYFQELVTHRRLAELLDFENKDRVFEDVDSRFKFSIILMTGRNAPQPATRCGFFLRQLADLDEPGRIFPLSADDFRLFNPNTLTCPIFRRGRDAELTRKIYENVPVLVRDTPEGSVNPWGVSFLRMFDMTNDTHLFHRADELVADGCYQDASDAGNVYTKGRAKFLPLYEGKMVQMYDHRAAGIVVNPANVHRPAQEAPATLAQHQDPDYSPSAQFWVDRAEVARSLRDKGAQWLLGFKSVTAPTNARSFICSVLPLCGAGNSMPIIRMDTGKHPACLIANLSSFVLDFAARQKIGGQNLNFFIVEQLPVLPPERYHHDWHGVNLAHFITARVLELTYTAHDLHAFAADLGHTGPPFPWDDERRLHLRCQLDALYFHLYGLSRSEAGEILDTFPIVQRQDEARYGGRFRTRDLILAYYNAYGGGSMDAQVKG